MLPIGHEGPISSAEFSADGKNILTLSTDGTAKLWDAGTGEILNEFRAYSDASIAMVTLAKFTPDGRKIVTVYDWSLSSVWETASLKPLWETLYGHIEAPSKNIMDQFSPDGKKLILFDFGNDGTIYNANTKNAVLTLKGHKSQLYMAAFSPDGKKIVTAAGDSTIKIWDVATGKTLITRKKYPAGISGIRFSTDSRKIFVVVLGERLEILDAGSGKLIADVKGYQTDYYEPFNQLSPDGKNFIEFSGLQYEDESHIYSHYDTVSVYDVHTQSLLFYKTNFSKKENAIFFSTDRIITKTDKNTVEVQDAGNGKLIYELTGHTDTINVIRFSPDGKKIITGSNDRTAKLWDAVTGKLIATLNGHSLAVTEVRFSPDGKRIATGSADRTVKIWDVVTHKQTSVLKGHIIKVRKSGFSDDAKKIIMVAANGSMTWNTENGNFLYEPAAKAHSFAEPEDFSRQINVYSPDSSLALTWVANIINSLTPGVDVNFGLDELIKDVVISPDNKRVLITTRNNIVKLYDIQKKEFIANFFILDSTDYIVQIPSGYYQSTPNAAKRLHYVTNNLKVISFEQLDVKYNRPDLVLETIGNSDSAVTGMYRNAYFKRIKKLAIDTAAFRDGYSVPEADFVNRNAISNEQNNENLILQIKGMDSIYALDRINLWINEVPVFGSKGKSLRSKKIQTVNLTLPVILSQGENRIETSVTNVNGTESYRMPMIINYTPVQSKKEKTYFIGIGIDMFADAKYNLQYSVKDIRDLTIKLKAKLGNAIIIDTLFNENVTLSNVKALKQKLQQSTVNDRVIVSYSGHGLLSKAYDYFLSTYSIKFDNPEENGLAYDELENLLDSIPARKKLMLIDACHSGEVDKEEFQVSQLNKAILDSNHVVAKGVVITNTDSASNKLGLKNSFELMQNLFVNVGKSTGATIISAAAGTEFALEKGSLKNGVFTYSVMEAMDKYPAIKISELKKIVGIRVEQLTNGMQRPTSRNEAIAVDWVVW